MSTVHLLNAHPDVAGMLSAHGLTRASEAPLEHTGFSGATLTQLHRPDGTSFVLKRVSIERDWIMRATDDVTCRERAITNGMLPDGIGTPLIGCAVDGDGFALLMRDIAPSLLSPLVDEATLDLILQRVAQLHASQQPDGVPWCDLTDRLTLLTPATARIAEGYGAPVAHDIIEGWRLFRVHAPPPAVRLIDMLCADPRPLIDALKSLPPAFLHGDLKFDNVGTDSGGQLWLIDWAMTLVAPAAIDIGWFMAINSRRTTLTLDAILELYGRHAGLSGDVRRRHDALAALCGLLLRGWRKALDAEEGDGAELAWWCSRALDAADLLRQQS